MPSNGGMGDRAGQPRIKFWSKEIAPQLWPLVNLRLIGRGSSSKRACRARLAYGGVAAVRAEEFPRPGSRRIRPYPRCDLPTHRRSPWSRPFLHRQVLTFVPPQLIIGLLLKVSVKGRKTRYLPLHRGPTIINDFLEAAGHGIGDGGALSVRSRTTAPEGLNERSRRKTFTGWCGPTPCSSGSRSERLLCARQPPPMRSIIRPAWQFKSIGGRQSAQEASGTPTP